jgi:predicted DNA-binding protein with PD1-like motif
MAGLQAFLEEERIDAAHLTGLGAASRLVIAYYDLGTKTYEKKGFTEDVEILSLIGNVGVKEDGSRVVHVHGVFGRRDFTTFGGHVFELVVSGAGEIHLTAFPGRVNRACDEETGLTLMCPATGG